MNQLHFTEIIRQRYSSMTNDQLLILYEDEIAELTTEARGLLIEELEKRKIYPPLIGDVSAVYYLPTIYSIDQLAPEIRYFVAESLEKGCNHGYLTGGLLERGLTEQEAKETIDILPNYYQKQSKINTDALLRSVFFTTAGLAMRVLPFNKENHLPFVIFSFFLILFGGMYCVHQILIKKRIQKIITSLSQIMIRC